MLNLLISIVSESYSQVLENEIPAKLKQRLMLNDQYINEFAVYRRTSANCSIYSLMFECKSEANAGKDSNDEIGTSARVKVHIKKLESDINSKISKLQDSLDKIDQKFD